MSKFLVVVLFATACAVPDVPEPDSAASGDALVTCPDCGGGGSPSPSPGSGNGPPPPVARVTACTDQAAEWCGAAGFGTSPVSGCATVYLQECNIAGPPIDGTKQRTCMLAIDSNPVPSQIPQACVDSWR